MSYRGRDAYYMELFLLCLSLSLGAVTTIIAIQGKNDRLLFQFIAPVWLWAVGWILSAFWMAIGLRNKQRSYVMYASGYICIMWIVVTANAWVDFWHFPMASGVAPVVALFAGRVYLYHHLLSITPGSYAESTSAGISNT
jgi:hypothetical protein